MPPVIMAEESGPTLSELMESKLELGWNRMERSCVACQTPLLQPPPRSITNKPNDPETTSIRTSKEVKRPGIPFCVTCKSHVITDASMLLQVQELEEEHGDKWVTGSILIDIATPTPSFDNGQPDTIKTLLSMPSQEGAELTTDDYAQARANQYVEETRDEAFQQEKRLGNLTLHDQLKLQEKESETYRMNQIREANRKRVAAEEELRKERLEAMRKEEEGRKEAQLRRQLEEIRETELRKLEQTESRIKQLQANEEASLKEQESRQKQEDEFLTRVLSESSTDVENDYQSRRETATKVLGTKMLQGFILKEEQCLDCEMPLMEKDSKVECVVCPALAKKSIKKKKTDPSEAEVKSNKAIDYGKKVMEYLEQAKQGIFESPSIEAAAKAQEAKYMGMLEEAKKLGVNEEKAENYMKELEKALAGPNFSTELSNSLDVKPRIEVHHTSMPVIDFLKTTKRETLSPDEEAEMRFKEEELFQKAMLQERQLEKERLLMENRRVEAARLAQKGKIEAETKLAEEQKVTALAKHQAEVREKKAELDRLAEAARLAEEEKQAAVKAALYAAKNNQDDNIIIRFEKEAEARKVKAEKASQLAQIAMDHLAKVHKKIFHDSVGLAAEYAVLEVDELLADENGVSRPKHDNKTSGTKEIEVIDPFPLSDLDALAITGEEGKTTKTTEIPKPLSKEEWEQKRNESRKKITLMMMSGWTMATEYCNGKHCRYSPLMTNKDFKECAVCGGTGTGLDGAYTNDPDAGKSDAPAVVAQPLPPPPPPPVPESPSNLSISNLSISSRSSPAKRSPRPALKINDKDFAEKRAFVSKEIGRKMLQGWTLLDVACPFCVMPLMTEKPDSEQICILCGPLEKKKKEEEIKAAERKKLEEQEKLREEMERLRIEKEKREKMEEELRIKREKEEAARRALEEQKRQDDLKKKSFVEAEVKKREEEIKEDLKKTEERVREKGHNLSDEMQRSAEKARLISERKRFAEIVKEVKKIEQVRKKQEDEDAKSTDSRRSRLSLGSRGSRRSRQSALPRISTIDDGDDASVGAVSIQFPPDFDYDDEDAIRQVISLAKLRRQSGSRSVSGSREPSPSRGIDASPPTSISFINDPSPESSRRRAPLLPPQSSEFRRRPLLPPGGRLSLGDSPLTSPLSKDHSRVVQSSDQEEYDDGVSHMSMGTHTPSEKETPEARRARILSRLNRDPSPSSRIGRSSTPTAGRRSLSSRLSESGTPRSNSLTRASRRSDGNLLPSTPTRRSYMDRSDSLKKISSKTTTPVKDDASVQSTSSRNSTLGDILSKIEKAKAQLVKKPEDILRDDKDEPSLLERLSSAADEANNLKPNDP